MRVTLVLVLLCAICCASATSMTGLRVVGNKIVNGNGQGVLLHGVNHAGTEYLCSQNRGITEGTVLEAILADIFEAPSIRRPSGTPWNVNTIRIPLNSICWLNPAKQVVDTQYGGTNYQTAIQSLVDTATNRGLAVILELHWNAPQPSGYEYPWYPQQRPMPDVDHTPAFWTSVASAYKGYSNVIFDLHNEPYPDGNQDTTAAWTCWRDGCFVSQEGYQAAGMTTLLSAVRSTGACNIVMLGGVCYANALSNWLQYKPTDSCGNLAASWHVYDWTVCNNQNCWDTVVAPVAAQVPLIVGEIGEGGCSHGFIDPLMTWLDGKQASYLGWTWNTWSCTGPSNGPSLISNYDGTATAFGVGLKNHLNGLSDSYTVPTIAATVSATGPTMAAAAGATGVTGGAANGATGNAASGAAAGGGSTSGSALVVAATALLVLLSILLVIL